jgi:arylsulfatase A-like enzyme
MMPATNARSAAFFLFASLAWSESTLPAAAASRPPNVVVLLADDQGWADLAVNGNTNARTPNLDTLARAGATFDRFYVCPVCSPTRAEFLTGRYFPRTGVAGVDSGRERINADETTVAETFKAAGYATGVFGKWHNGGQGPYHPNARGFDEFYGFTAGHWGWYFDAPMEHNGREMRGRGYIADDLTERALEFVAQNRARPFLCYVAFNTPHSPFCVPDEYWNRWKDAPLALRSPDAAREDPTTTRCVLAMNENLDWNVGRASGTRKRR